MADVAALQELIAPEVEAEGLSLVRVKLIGGTSDPTIQVMAERPETRQLSIEECERLHRRIAEAHEHISDDYRLEVSSPHRPRLPVSDYRIGRGTSPIGLPRFNGRSRGGTLRGSTGGRADRVPPGRNRLPLPPFIGELVPYRPLMPRPAALHEGADIIEQRTRFMARRRLRRETAPPFPVSSTRPI